eukprot:TRINITY_DN7634_c0_g1_i5.p1 TRINITY_DN7634_c0_g1~~TRINITY_DN7634_c0_g1_i5.p1  ORF type:complete len:250 (+),score=62.88 TRINITY_DN7634_c0_g1_i5:590-1339(+)
MWCFLLQFIVSNQIKISTREEISFKKERFLTILNNKKSILCGKLEGEPAESKILEYVEKTGRERPYLAAKIFAKLMNARTRDRDWTLLSMLIYSQVPDDGAVKQLMDEQFDIFREDILNDHPEAKEAFDEKWYKRIIGILSLNLFKVRIPHLNKDLQPSFEMDAGKSLYFLSSMYNHSCIPNVSPSFTGANSKLEMISNTKIEKDDELFISYIDSTLPYEERKELLLEAYGFECNCAKCTGELESNKRV